MSTTEQAQQIARRVNLLLGEHHVPVGAKVAHEGNILVGCYWCPLSECFHAWIPLSAQPVVDKLVEVFTKAGFADVIAEPFHSNEQFIQIDAYAQ